MALAVVLALGTGLGYRLVAARFGALPSSVALPPGTLASVPLHVGQWTGCDLPVEARIIKQTDTDDHLSRRYTRPGGGSVALWVAYGVRLRDLMPHRPEVCYVGAGWSLHKEQLVNIRVSEGSSLPCRLLSFRKSGLESQRLLVLNYYLVGKAYSADVSSLRAQASQLDRNTGYVAQVQIVQEGGETDDVLGQPVCAFAAEIGPLIRRVLDEAVSRNQP